MNWIYFDVWGFAVWGGWDGGGDAPVTPAPDVHGTVDIAQPAYLVDIAETRSSVVLAGPTRVAVAD